jgi:hypothetical protein
MIPLLCCVATDRSPEAMTVTPADCSMPATSAAS